MQSRPGADLPGVDLPAAFMIVVVVVVLLLLLLLPLLLLLLIIIIVILILILLMIIAMTIIMIMTILLMIHLITKSCQRKALPSPAWVVHTRAVDPGSVLDGCGSRRGGQTDRQVYDMYMYMYMYMYIYIYICMAITQGNPIRIDTKMGGFPRISTADIRTEREKVSRCYHKKMPLTRRDPRWQP